MRCDECQSETSVTLRPRAFERGGRLIVVRDVPLQECDACGEVYLTTIVAGRLDVITRHVLDGPSDVAVVQYLP